MGIFLSDEPVLMWVHFQYLRIIQAHLLCSIKLVVDTKQQWSRPENKILHLIISLFNEIMNI